MKTNTERFDALFDAHSPRVFAYVRRHAAWSVVEDIVAETFLITWRRIDDVPHDALPWLLVVARNTLANHRRTFARHDTVQLEGDALDRLASHEPAADDVVIGRATMLHALGSLSPGEREALLLIAWDGLSPAAAAQVSGCSPRTFSVRLHRARRRLSRAIEIASETTTDHLANALPKETS